MKKKSQCINTEEPQERTTPTENFEEGKGNVRYIGGYCISKLKYQYQKQVQSSLHDPKKESRIHIGRKKLTLISKLITPYSELVESTKFIETLSSTSRKQNIRQGLTNITDSAYLFFETLNHKVRKLETFKNLHLYGKTVIEVIKSNIFNDTELFHDWLKLFTEDTNDHVSEDEDALHYLTELFKKILIRFVNVSASHFRKDYLQHVKREKGKAHRKKVMEKKRKKSCRESIFR